jgi:hypothetical protein
MPPSNLTIAVQITRMLRNIDTVEDVMGLPFSLSYRYGAARNQ